MNVRLPTTPTGWQDPDDAPELTEEWFDGAVWKIGDQVVSKTEAQAAIAKRLGRPPAKVVRPMVSMRMDPDVLEKLRATGPGWQTRVNALLREAVEKGKV